ncbi:transposase [Streptomyces sp. NPDC058335]|uniref:transposase n=1 Tax=Streptomyces sp. NPDC058335 TaxID=3346451 RepID=UPI00366241EB
MVWDNLNTHLAAGLKRYEAAHDWLTTVHLPPYAPDLNPVEAVWSPVRRAVFNTAFDTPDDLDRVLRRELRSIQLRPHLIDGCLTAGLLLRRGRRRMPARLLSGCTGRALGGVTRPEWRVPGLRPGRPRCLLGA